jgi:hypothetical protein
LKLCIVSSVEQSEFLARKSKKKHLLGVDLKAVKNAKEK